MMNYIAEALGSNPAGLITSMFVVARSEPSLESDLRHSPSAPRDVSGFELEDSEGVLSGLRVIEYDMKFAELPSNLHEHLLYCLRTALDHGAEVAWFAFESAFSFDYLLVPSVRPDIYAVADLEGITVVSDDKIESREWRMRLARARRRLNPSGLMTSMFVVARSEPPLEPDLRRSPSAPSDIYAFEVSDSEGVLGGRHVYEYDMRFADLKADHLGHLAGSPEEVVPALPGDLEEHLLYCMRAALKHGVEVAWFEIEGMFSFGTLLAPEASSDIYAVADPEGISVVSDDELESPEWRERLGRARRRLLPGAPAVRGVRT